MNISAAKAKREAEIRDKLPDDVVELVDAAMLDPGAPFESGAVALLSGLRASDPAAWSRTRAMLKPIEGVMIRDLDRMTAPAGGDGDGKQGREMEWPDPDPCADPVDGAPMLSRIAAFIRRHVWIDEPEADALALWAVMTWIHDRLEISTFANLTSATKRCGKSLLLELLGELVYRPQPLSGQVTGAVLFRMVELHAPTLMLDEADTYIRDDEAVRGIVNGSQRRALAYIPRCVEPDYQPRLFGTWCPKLIAGIGGIPETIRDRSLVVRLERKPASERVSPWRERDREAVEAMRAQIARWTGDNTVRIVAALPAVAFPDALHDRARDAWESLLAIANAAGGEWAGRGGRAWKACERVMASTAGEDTGTREMLLADLRAIFEAEGWPAALGSKAILDKLTAMEGRSWGEWSRGKSLSAHGLSKLLKPFEIRPRKVRISGENSTVQGYPLADLRPVWGGYLPDNPIPPCTDPEHRNNPAKQGVSCDPETEHCDGAVPDLDRTKPHETRDCSDVPDLQPPSRANGADSAPAPVSLPKQPAGTERAGDAYRRLSRGE